MTFPKFSHTKQQERYGVNAVAVAVARLGLIWRETQSADVGIDGQIEYVTPEGAATGRMVAVQIKCGLSYLQERMEIGSSTRTRSIVFIGSAFLYQYWL